MALLSGAGAGSVSAAVMNHFQQEEANVFPVLFSGVVRLDAPNEAARFYAAVNDMAMAVTEGWNAARAAKDYGVAASVARDTALGDYATEVGAQGNALLAQLAGHRDLEKRASAAASELGAAWSYRSKDNYRTETYTETTTDSQGKTRTRTRTRRVYDDTDHYFTFHRQRAESACAAVDRVLTIDGHALYWPFLEEVVVPVAGESVGGDGPYRSAAGPKRQGSRSEHEYVRDTVLEDPEAEVDDEGVAQLLAVWSRHAGASRSLSAARGALDSLRADARIDKRTMMDSRDSYHFNTSSRTHAGPPGYRAARELKRHADRAAEEVGALVVSIRRAQVAAERLAAVAEGGMPDVWAGDGDEPLDAEALARAMLDDAVEAYVASFPSSPIRMDQRVKTRKTVGVGIVVALIVAGVAAILHPESGML